MPSELYNQIVSQRGSVENLLSKIPGFKGYMAKDARRSADRMLRERLGSEIDKHIKRYNKIQKDLLDGGKGLRFMSRAREVKSQMQAYHDKVVTAAPKYSGMFEKINITEEILDRIYSFDEAQFRSLLQFDTALDDLQAAVDSGEGVEDALDTVDDIASNAASAFDMRDDEILNIGT
ncbi:MAG: hypothetical protein Q9P01_06020 [Anaerolineae bacterium]|nr:hypothetical protein [Anaerolineae bacterium]